MSHKLGEASFIKTALQQYVAGSTSVARSEITDRGFGPYISWLTGEGGREFDFDRLDSVKLDEYFGIS
ncbi:MAG: hypothetical protein A2Y73_04040 [Chloroflexi bacterium RBG_13_56_8]|nr:MAG: hypothetical protein A2Y73_04040 [Chloroflexi bacterium RBG_13_56_8]